jgi:acyl-coenzyme A thioesterase PaaI-like protein
MPSEDDKEARHAWRNHEPERIIGRGHMAGDFLEAHDWKVVERRPGYLKVDAHLPDHLKNPRGQLFGGYTPTYVDLVALRTAATARAPGAPALWLTTVSMHIDYLEPVVEPRFIIEGDVIHRRRGTHLVEVRFRRDEGNMLVFAVVTLKDTARVPPMSAT